MSQNAKLNRRNFIKCSALGAIGSTIGVPAVLTSCSSETAGTNKTGKVLDIEIPVLKDKAADGKPLKAGLVGCGGRGTGAVINMMDAANGIELVALGDIFPDKMESCRKTLNEKKGITVADDKCFVGFDSYKQVIDSGIDIVLLCTPPYFRAEHFAYAIEQGKHCFIEKPCCVDMVGARQMLVAGKKAQAKNLCVISGTVRRSQKDVCATLEQVANGAIGQIVSAQVVRLGGTLWENARQKDWDDMTYMMRDWPNFYWLSGDQMTEQFIHEVDLMNLFLGDNKPVSVSAIGGRARRKTGDVFDSISAEFTYEKGIRSHCMARQINGCGNEHRVTVYGTEGYTDCFCTIYNYDGTVKWAYKYPDGQPGDGWKGLGEGYVLEHVRLIDAIRTGKVVNDVEKHVQSTVMGNMAREASYTGKILTWADYTASEQKLGPAEIKFGAVNPPIPEQVPVPGVDAV